MSGGKLIPYGAAQLNAFAAAVLPMLHDLVTHHPGVAEGHLYAAISPATRAPETTATGILVGLVSDAAYLGALADPFARLLAVPDEVGAITDVETWRTRTLTDLVEADDLSFVTVWSPSFFTALIEALPGAADRVLPRLTPGARTRLEHWLAAGPEAGTSTLWPASPPFPPGPTQAPPRSPIGSQHSARKRRSPPGPDARRRSPSPRTSATGSTPTTSRGSAPATGRKWPRRPARPGRPPDAGHLRAAGDRAQTRHQLHAQLADGAAAHRPARRAHPGGCRNRIPRRPAGDHRLRPPRRPGGDPGRDLHRAPRLPDRVALPDPGRAAAQPDLSLIR